MHRLNIFIIGLGIFISLFFICSIYFGITPKNAILIINPHEITPVSPLYYIKVSREYLQSQFIFGDEDLSLWNFTLAKKRLEESKILNSYHLNNLSQKQIELAQIYQNQGILHLNKLIDKIDVNYLIKLRDNNQTLLQSFNNFRNNQ